MNSSTFLSQPCHFHHPSTLIINMGCHSQNSTNCNNSSTPYTGNDNVIGAMYFWKNRIWQFWEQNLTKCFRLDFSSFNSNKRWTKPFYTTEIFITRRLINSSFSTQFSLNRYYRNAVRLNTTISTAFTYISIYKYSLIRIWKFSTLSSTTLFCRTGLYVNNSRDTFFISDFFLNILKF